MVQCMYRMQPADKNPERMAIYKNSGDSQAGTIPVERDTEGNDITPDIKTFLEKGGGRSPKPVQDEVVGKDIQ